MNDSYIFKGKYESMKSFIECLPHKNRSRPKGDLDSPRLAGHAKVKTSEVTSSKCSRNKRVIMGIKVDEPLPSCGGNASTQPGTFMGR